MCGRGLGRGGHDTTGDLCSVGFKVLIFMFLQIAQLAPLEFWGPNVPVASYGRNGGSRELI